MGKKLLSVLAILLTALVGVATVLFIYEYINNPKNVDLLIISIIFALITLVLIIAVIFDLFVGHNELIFKKEQIILGRKGEILYSIPKSNVLNPVLTYDSNNKESCMLSFKSGRKKYYVSINKGNKKAIDAFLKDVKYTKRENTLEYFLQHILDILSAI